MAVLTTSRTWLNVAATTIENYQPNFYDQITDSLPIVKMMKQNASVQLDGGDGIIVEIMHKHNNTVGTVGEWDTLDLTPPSPFTAVRYDWKDMAGALSVSGDEIDRNQGKSRMMNLLQGKIKNLRISFQNRLDTMLLGDGTGNNGKDLNGLSALITDSGTGTVGGIERDNNEWWRNVSYSYATASNDSVYYGCAQGGTANTKTAADLVGAAGDDYDTTFLYSMDYVFDECSFGDTGPQMLLGSMGAWQRCKHTLLDNKRFDMADTMRADPGFRYVNFNGVPFAFTRKMNEVTNYGNSTDTQRIYFLNFDFMNFWIHHKKNFKTTEFKTLLPKQEAWAMNMFLKAQLGVTKSNAQGLLHSIKI